MLMTEHNEKARESRLRRLARSQGLQLVKSRTRNPEAPSYGGFLIADDNRVLVAGEHYRSLDEVEHYLTDED